MYFNSNKNDTNIDKDFNNNKNILSTIISFFNKFKVPIIIGIVIIIIIIVIIIFTSNNNSNNTITPNVETYLVLSGDEVINIAQGDDYIEPGYKAYNENNEDLTKDVDITTNLNINQVGEYEITYKIGNVTKTRKINIIDKNNTTNEYTYIYLNTVNNNVDIYLKVGEKYTEPGYKVYSTSGKNLNDSVKITGSVDTSKRGNYTLTYSLTDENNKTISVTRTVIVMDTDINLSLNTTSYTNKNVEINVKVIDNYFDYLIKTQENKMI